MIVEVEVDSLAQLEEVLPAGPDIVLLDNMPPEMLRAAVARCAALAPGVELEASGGVNLDTVRAVAASGVERISVGADALGRGARSGAGLAGGAALTRGKGTGPCFRMAFCDGLGELAEKWTSPRAGRRGFYACGSPVLTVPVRGL